jgi:endogenous inhibitor of DNA gyrase (YacG/DUF329 family)
MTNVLTVTRWCPRCEKLFEATKIIQRVGREATASETPCPTCGTPGQLLLQR